MKIGALVHMYPPHHLAGAEMMLHAILKTLAPRHVCKVVISQGPNRRTLGLGRYTIDGVSVSEDMADLDDVDVLLTHLDRTPDAMLLSGRAGIPLAHIVHNHLTLLRCNVTHADLIVYNSQWLAEAVAHPSRSIVVRPPVFADEYRTTPGDSITLVNMQDAKGVDMFYALAERRPDLKFLGVTGAYGRQVLRESANVTILPPQQDMRSVYGRTAVLLMPSHYESWGRCAIEAAASGIPTIANRTPGLLEALGTSGVFPDTLRVDVWDAALTETLADWRRLSAGALARSHELDPAADIAALEAALTDVVRRHVETRAATA